MAEDKKISQLDPGGTVQVTDILPAVRDGANVYVSIASAGTKAASDDTKNTVASINGATVAGHLAVFTDEDGTVGDGGEVGAIITEATSLDIVLTTDFIPIVRGGVIYLASVDAVLHAQAPSGGGGQFDFSDSINSAFAAII